MQLPESKWNEELKAKDTLIKKVKTLQDKLLVANEQIENLQQALAAVTHIHTAADLNEGSKAELKMAREAYKSFSFTYEDGTWHFEFYCDPMVKKVELLTYRRLK